MSSDSFIHLHIHSDYSLLDGACRLDKLISKVQELGMPAVALTDHGNMFGALEFYKAAKKAGIKPLIGCECYVITDDLHKREKTPMYHLTLLCKNKTGYNNLILLNTIAHRDGYYYKPRLDIQTLRRHSEGLVALSGCIGGQVAQAVLAGDLEEAEKAARQYIEIFGKENFFIEVHRHGLEEEKQAEPHLLDIARKLDIDIVGANDAHYINKQDALAHDVLLCVQTGAKLSDDSRMRFANHEFYIKSTEEMRELYWDIPQAVENTRKVMDMCEVDFKFGDFNLPRYYPPDNIEPDKYLRDLCFKGLAERYDPITDEARERLEYELGIIEKMGFVSYFLITWDFINHSRTTGIPVGPGRGSAAGSLVAYTLGITNIDPLKYGLLFERFLNPERVSMPDIDIDFCYEGREDVIKYVAKKYGSDNVSQIITFGTLGAKAVVRDVGRVLGMTYSEVDAIAKLIPAELDITLEKAFSMEPELTKACERSPQVKRLFDIACTLEGLVRNVSTHAAGIVVSERPLTENVPLARGGNAGMCTQYAKDNLEEIGLLKMDFLGLRTLTVIRDCLRNIKSHRGIDIDVDKLSFDDEKTYQMLQRGCAVGVFQLESAGMRDAMMKMQVSNFDDLQSLLALYRPGPMKFIPDYISRKKGETVVEYDHPLLEPVLESTYGIMVYQEQVMKCANVIAGYTLGEADQLRRIMGKKIASKMAEQKDIFVKGSVENNIDKATAEKIFDTMSYFAGYGFNKSHSAAYAMIAYQTAYLKANYPVEFMAGIMSNEINNPDKLARLLSETKDMGIKVLPPDINESQSLFAVVGDDAIRFGFAAIKNVGRAAADKIIENRGDKPFKDLVDVLERVDSRVINKKVLESLVKCGGFDSMVSNRASLVEGLDQMIKLFSDLQKDKDSGQTDFFSEDETFKQNTITLPDVPPWDKNKILADEKSLMGFYVSGHPLDEYRIFMSSMCTCDGCDLEGLAANKKVVMGGIVRSVRVVLTKSRGEKMAIVTMEDTTANYTVVIYSKLYLTCAEMLSESNVLFVRGEVSERDGGTVIAGDLFCVDDTFEKVASVGLSVPGEFFDNGGCEDLIAHCSRYRGIKPLYFNVWLTNEQMVTVKAGQQMGVTPSREFFAGLDGMLNKNDVDIDVSLPAPKVDTKPRRRFYAKSGG